MFIGYEITPATKRVLLARFPPRYAKRMGRHITERFGVARDAPPPPAPARVTVIGHFDSGDGVEGLLVEVDGRRTSPDGRSYHLTWSLGPGCKPVESNRHVHRARPTEPIDIRVTPKNFW